MSPTHLHTVRNSLLAAAAAIALVIAIPFVWQALSPLPHARDATTATVAGAPLPMP